MVELKMITCLGENTVPICTEIAQYLNSQLGWRIEFVPEALPTEAAEPLCRGEVEIGWICGLLYVLKYDQENVPFDLLAAPVFRGDDAPVYYSNLIVAQQSPWTDFDQLKGLRLAINETTSYSGNHLLRSTLNQMNLGSDYFGEVIVSGAHSKSVRAVIDGVADTATIDHSVYNFVMDQSPELEKEVRIIKKLGPSPSPPFVVHESVPAQVRETLKSALIDLANNAQFLKAVAPHRLVNLVPIRDQDYVAIRKDYSLSQQLKDSIA